MSNLVGRSDGNGGYVVFEDGVEIGTIWRCSPTRWTTSRGGKESAKKRAMATLASLPERELVLDGITAEIQAREHVDVVTSASLENITVDPAYADGRGALVGYANQASRER